MGRGLESDIVRDSKDVWLLDHCMLLSGACKLRCDVDGGSSRCEWVEEWIRRRASQTDCHDTL